MTFRQLRKKRKQQKEFIGDNPTLKMYLADLDKVERDLIQKRKEKVKKSFKIISNIILWLCAVGGFVLALVQFFQN